MRILIADDHALFRDSLATLLEVHEIEVVGSAVNGREAIDLARASAPDIVLMDLEMPIMNGIEATEILSQELPDTRIVILTGSESDQSLVSALRAGACGYLLKDLEGQRFIEYLEGCMRGEPALSPHLAKRLVDSAVSPSSHDPDALTEREVEVLELMTEGVTSNRKLARSLGVSENTIKFHVRNILDKLHLHSRAEAVGYALRNHLTPQRHLTSQKNGQREVG